MDSGVARKPIADLDRYANELASRLDPVASIVQRVVARVRMQPKRMVFAEGEEEAVIRAALSYQNSGLGKAILVGDPERIDETARQAGIEDIPRTRSAIRPRKPAHRQNMPKRSTNAGNARARSIAIACAR